MASLSQPVPKPVRPWRSDPITRLMTLVPFLLVLYADTVGAPKFGMLGKPPELLGIPLGLWFQLAVLGWAAVGVGIVWTTHHRLVAALALVLCSFLSVLALLVGPALILILQNLS